MGPIWKNNEKSFWSQSGASIRETEGLKEDEKKAGSPKKCLKQLENAYGRISFDIDDKKEIKITVARQTAYEEEGLREDQKELEHGHISPVCLRGTAGYTDSHHKEDSAIVWKEDIQVSPEQVIKHLKELARISRQKTLTQMIPGLLPEESQVDRAFQENLLKRVKKNLSEAISQARTEDKEESPAFLAVSYQEKNSLPDEADDGSDQEENNREKRN